MKNTGKTLFLSVLLILLIHGLPGNTCLAQKKDVMESIAHSKRDSTEKRSSFNAYPYAYYTPETSLAFGAGGIFVFYTSDNPDLKPSKIGFGGMYTISKQYNFGVNPKFYFLDSKMYVDIPLRYGYSLDRLYGLGPDSEETGNESYTKKFFTASLTLQVPPVIFAADRTGIIFDFNHTEIVDKRSNELLINNELTGSNGGNSFGIGSDLVWDSRDNIFFPNAGGYQYFKIVIYPEIDLPTFSFMELDVKQFFAFAPDHVIGGNFYMSSTSGDAPFYLLPALGGQKRMRGYFMGRHRDNFFMMFQAEYRQYFWRDFGFVVFGDVGNVSNDLLSYSFKNVKYSFGGGLRYKFNKKEKINLRVDIGIGPNKNMGIYFGIEEAF